MKNKNFYMLAKTMYGLEKILSEELKELGAQDVKLMNRAVSFRGDKGFMYKANLNLRTALRILKPIRHFQAKNEKELYKRLCEIDWTNLFDLDNTFSTHATTHSEIFKHSKYASLLMKDAIADTFRKKFNKRPNVNAYNADIIFNLHISKHTCTVSLDSSGDSLHKRGYKLNTVTAPINEVLAAGLILLSNWNKVANFHDPMCGSGTLLIEASLIAYNIPANIFREQFGFEKWKDFDRKLWETIKEVSLNKEKNYHGNITGSDNFQKSVRITRENINNALMRDDISVFVKDFFDSNSINSHVIFNPPYGARIGDKKKLYALYARIGTVLKSKFPGWRVGLITSDRSLAKTTQLKFSFVSEPVSHGGLKVRLYHATL